MWRCGKCKKLFNRHVKPHIVRGKHGSVAEVCTKCAEKTDFK